MEGASEGVLLDLLSMIDMEVLLGCASRPSIPNMLLLNEAEGLGWPLAARRARREAEGAERGEFQLMNEGAGEAEGEGATEDDGVV